MYLYIHPTLTLFFPFLLTFRRPTLTAKDIDDIQNWGIKHNVDFIAASFVRKQSDVEKIREVLGSAGGHIKIICKIENLEGVQNYMDILKSTDGIMVVRTLVATRFTLYPNINALSSKVQPIHSHALFLIYYNLLLPF